MGGTLDTRLVPKAEFCFQLPRIAPLQGQIRHVLGAALPDLQEQTSTPAHSSSLAPNIGNLESEGEFDVRRRRKGWARR